MEEEESRWGEEGCPSKQSIRRKEGKKNHRASERLGQAINAEGPPRCQMVLGDTPLNNAQNTPDLVSI